MPAVLAVFSVLLRSFGVHGLTKLVCLTHVLHHLIHVRSLVRAHLIAERLNNAIELLVFLG